VYNEQGGEVLQRGACSLVGYGGIVAVGRGVADIVEDILGEQQLNVKSGFKDQSRESRYLSSRREV
jgi:hypothetical protein